MSTRARLPSYDVFVLPDLLPAIHVSLIEGLAGPPSGLLGKSMLDLFNLPLTGDHVYS